MSIIDEMQNYDTKKQVKIERAIDRRDFKALKGLTCGEGE